MASLYFLYQKYKARKAAPEAEPPAPSLEKDLESAKPSLDAPAGVRVTTDVERSPPTGVKRDKAEARAIRYGNPLKVVWRIFILPVLLPLMFAQPERRHRDGIRACLEWAISVIGVGLVFTILASTGTFPASVDEMKAIDMYGFYIAKYILYFLAGTTTTTGCLLLYKSLKLRRSLTLGWLMITLALFCTAATVGMSLYNLVKDYRLNVAWWSYLIIGLMLFQRLCLFVATVVVIIVAREASDDEAVRALVVERSW